MPRHIVCLTFDFDTASGFIARGLTTPTPLSRGEFGRIGARRILELLKRYDAPGTWFTPGFTIESFPAECEAIVAAGHEIGHHSWAHVPPASQSRAEEEADMARAIESIVKLTGAAPRGYRSPSWDLSDATIELLVANGFDYDSSLMGADYEPYKARNGDRGKVGEPFHFGRETDLMEMPISWTMDDHPHFEFYRTPDFLMPGLQSPRAVMESWKDEFTYMKKITDWGILTYTMHPYVIGRGYRMLAFEGLMDFLGSEGAVFLTMADAAREARARLFP
ncbi:polysaccharide deacetylase [Chelatococcus sp. GCM10030263]|uniref:polysaccharide deacetylase family protein n=1 Tax=Chelatococcus sp. GCM10030263 TaxID=3273387 RepID=UPI003608ED46